MALETLLFRQGSIDEVDIGENAQHQPVTGWIGIKGEDKKTGDVQGMSHNAVCAVRNKPGESKSFPVPDKLTTRGKAPCLPEAGEFEEAEDLECLERKKQTGELKQTQRNPEPWRRFEHGDIRERINKAESDQRGDSARKSIQEAIKSFHESFAKKILYEALSVIPNAEAVNKPERGEYAGDFQYGG